MKGWEGVDGKNAGFIAKEADKALKVYCEDPNLVEEHSGQEQEAKTGGYGRRQIFELVQNGADQLQPGGGRLQVTATDDALYCANAGKAFSEAGVVGVLHAYLSAKDDDQIGRFGLGFKSVLGVTSSPTVLSRSGSFRFSPAVAERIREFAPEAKDLPLLRMAEPIEPDELVAADPILAELAEWAATIVYLPFDESPGPTWLASGIATFPRPFLVFAGQVETLRLEDRVTDLIREISADRTEHGVTVREGDETEDWQVYDMEVPLSEESRERAGKLADREAVTVKWAVRPEGATGLGQFWSYFPSDDETTLRGVVNAPWQLDETRLHLVPGPYNEAILDGAGELVLGSLDDVRASAADKSRYLELMPGRGREPRCWADGILTNRINDLASKWEAIPLLDGELEVAARARLHPDELPTDALEAWSEIADPAEWVDHSVDLQKDRRARVERYMGDAGNVTSGLDIWFAAAAGDATPEQGIWLVRLAGRIAEMEEAREVLGTAEFILTENGDFVRPSQPGLMLPGEYAADSEDVVLIDRKVAQDEEARAALLFFGLKELSAAVELRRLAADSGREDFDWENFWRIARRIPAIEAESVLVEIDGFSPHVRTLDGAFRRNLVTLLPGPCVPIDGSRDSGATIDVQWHREELDLLRKLGCTDAPSVGYQVEAEPWFDEYRRAGIEAFLERNKPARPSVELIRLKQGSATVGPLTVLHNLGDEGRASVTQVALQGLDGPTRWSVGHTSVDDYEDASIPNPSVWMILREGMLETPVGPRPIGSCVGPALGVGDLTPAPTCSEDVAAALDLPSAWSEVDAELLGECLDSAAEAEAAEAAVLYAAMAISEDVAAPEVIRCSQVGTSTMAPPEDVAVTADEAAFELMARGSAPVLLARDGAAAEALKSHWGLQDGDALVKRRVAVASTSDPVNLLDEFPPLRKRLEPATRDSTVLQRCEDIRIVEETVGGTRSRDVGFARDGNHLYCLEEMDNVDVLRGISRELGLDLSRDEIDRVIRGAEDRRTKELEKTVRGEESDGDRLALLLGKDGLRAVLPKPVVDTFTEVHGEPTVKQLARLALSVHGTEVLKQCVEALADKGLNPPTSWRGTPRAKEFVRNLGFAAELAGFPSDPRPAQMVVEGRPYMPELHDYQREIVERLGTLLAERRDNRAMLSLPTGSGKTRVAIEGCVTALSEGLLERDLILWVAQSDELCEQAVQAWSELWRAREVRDRLTISRLWGGSNQADPAGSGFQVVVATIQKLERVVENASYEWLSEAGTVVIDEAHGAVTKRYTALLEWLGLSRGKFAAPLLGLSATPYRGQSIQETKRLAKRFGGRRLDVEVLGQEDHYELLQKEGVLSEVKHEMLEGADLSLSEAQVKDVKEKRLLPTEAGTRLGEDSDRTGRVIDHIKRLPDDWPVLVFAPSVENAQVLAGLLEHDGISAAAISGETADEARRWYIREFREERIRVITNYGVLTEGFDAPKVKAVYIARPVFAPNRYQQMIGRGLRGPKNGGNAECLIVDVRDNIENLDDLLAYREFEYLWDPELAGVGTDA